MVYCIMIADWMRYGFLMKSIAPGKKEYCLLEKEPRQVTNFI